jgi:UDP-2-acetamido-3-amino-2,3-dideoxy-glucuronate N-acetyltransferase
MPTTRTPTRSTRIHPTANVEDGVTIGPGTTVWEHVHVRGPAQIGAECIIGEKSYIGYGVRIGDRVKINAFVYIPTGVTVDAGVMISAGTIFTNDRFPRATGPDLAALLDSGPGEHTLPTRVREGATIGAASTIGCDLEIGRFAMVGMGSVVTRTVPDFHLVLGAPARTVGCVCRCGQPIARSADDRLPDRSLVACRVCGLEYSIRDGWVTEIGSPA